MIRDDRLYRAWWERAWHERGNAVRQVLGQTTPPGSVRSFSWHDPDLVVPGACALTFSPAGQRPHWLMMTLGLTQPMVQGGKASAWEFAWYASEPQPWCYELLYDLVTGWSQNRTHLERGHFLPVTFFRNSRGQLDCAAEDLRGKVEGCNDKTGLYLWASIIDRTVFRLSTGDFFLMSATIVTRDEESLVDETSPPHLLLLLKRLGVGQLCAPDRPSVRCHPEFIQTWDQIKSITHDEALRQLNDAGGAGGR
jgi:hypothetical protein